MNKWIIGTAAATLVAIPALALMPDGHHGWMKGPHTRAEVEAKVKERFAAIDANKDGAVIQAEADAYRDAKRAEKRGRMFESLDTDKNGQISRAEATGKALEMFDKADANKDGTVTPEERRDAWKAHMQERMGDMKTDS